MVGGEMKSILHPSFRYISSANTDIRKTFARIRREGKVQTGRKPDENDSSKGTPVEAPPDARGLLESGRDNSVRRLPIRNRANRP